MCFAKGTLAMTHRLLTALTLALVLPACDKPEPGDPDDKGMSSGDTEDGSTGDTDGSSSGVTDGGSTGAAEVPCDAEHFQARRDCTGGSQYCSFNSNGEYAWGTCVANPVCQPGESGADCSICELDTEGVPYFTDGGCGGSTPLALRFDEQPVRFAMSSATFDLGPECGATDWPGAATPWLALDRDGSGAIEGGHELFGSATRLRDGARADHGFTALAELDADRDGRIDADDPAFARLVLWADHDADRRSTTWELTPVVAAGLLSVDLDYRRDTRCDARGNCEIERASFSFRDTLGRLRTGEIVDLHLACQ